VPYEVAHREDVRPYFSVCPVCHKPGSLTCNHCHVIKYCDIECQKKDFHNHKKICTIFKRRKELTKGGSMKTTFRPKRVTPTPLSQSKVLEEEEEEE